MNASDSQMGRSTWNKCEASHKRHPKFRISGTQVHDVDYTIVRHGLEQGSTDNGVGETKVREGSREDLSSSVRFGIGTLSTTQGLVETRPALHKSKSESGGEPGSEPLQGIAVDGSELGYLSKA